MALIRKFSPDTLDASTIKMFQEFSQVMDCRMSMTAYGYWEDSEMNPVFGPFKIVGVASGGGFLARDEDDQYPVYPDLTKDGTSVYVRIE